MILEHLHFCLANHACVSHLLRGQPHLLECYYRNCLIRTHMCVHPVSEWSVFLPFSVNCSEVAMFQKMPALCPHGQGEEGWSTKCGQAWTGRGGVQKISKFVWTSFMDDPHVVASFELMKRIFFFLFLGVVSVKVNGFHARYNFWCPSAHMIWSFVPKLVRRMVSQIGIIHLVRAQNFPKN